MKTVTLRRMQHNLSEIIRDIDHGQEVLVTRHRRVIARLVPVGSPPTAKPKWPDFAALAVPIRGVPLAETLREERDS